jgi:hypothetical protein
MENKQAQAIIDYIEARLAEALGRGDSIGYLRDRSDKRREKRDELIASFRDVAIKD